MAGVKIGICCRGMVRGFSEIKCAMRNKMSRAHAQVSFFDNKLFQCHYF